MPPGGYQPTPMPPMMMPPMMYPPPPPAPRGGGFARAIFNTLAVTILGLSISLNIYFLLGSIFSRAIASDEHITTTTVQEGDSENRIAVIPITSEIRDSTALHVDSIIKAIKEDNTIRGIVVQIDTPGGAVTPSDEIYNRLLQLKKERNIRIVIAQKGLATSGGYYISCAGDYVFAQPTTWTGNIGVLLPNANVANLMDKYGVKDTTVVSNGTPFKTAGSYTQPETPEARAYLQGLVDQAFTTFKKVVTTGRGKSLAKPIDEIANGKVYSADEAKALGLIDAIGYDDDAYAKAATLAGVTKPEVVKFDRIPSLVEALSGGRDAKFSGKIEGVHVDIDNSVVEQFVSRRPMYLWRGW